MTDPRANQDSLETSTAFSTRIPKDEHASAGLQDPGHSKVRTQPPSSSAPENEPRLVPAGESIPKEAVVIDPSQGAAQRTVNSGAATGFKASSTLSGATSGDYTGTLGQPTSGVSSDEAHHIGQGTSDDQKSRTVNRKAEDHDHPAPNKSQGFRGDN